MSTCSPPSSSRQGLSLTTLGTLTVRIGDQELPSLSQTKRALLLVHLVLSHDTPCPREELAAHFWPDRTTAAARTNLRQALRQLKQQLGPAWSEGVVLHPQHVHWRPEAAWEADCETLAAHASAAPPADEAAFQAAIAACRRYRGHFLQHLAPSGLREDDGLSVWIRERRHHYWRCLLKLLDGLLAAASTRAAQQQLIEELQRLDSLAPFDEAFQQRLLRGLARGPDPSEARFHYRLLELRFLRELGTGPVEQLLAELPPSKDSAAGGSPGLPAERRQIAVVACLLGHQPPPVLDDETYSHRLETAQDQVETAFIGLRGHCQRIPGGGVLGYFGYPSARESMTRDAVRAARSAVRELPAGIVARAAVEAGTIITGTDPEWPDPAGRLTTAVLGCAREAAAGEVRISEAVRERIGHPSPLPPLRIGGLAFTTASRIRGLPASATRPAAIPLPEEGPLIGRQAELKTLLEHWERARQGSIQAVLLQGEAGLGKSRLLRELVRRIRKQGGATRLLVCQREHERRPFAPLQRTCGDWLARAREGTRTSQSTDPDDRNLLVDALIDTLSEELTTTPLLLVCDDLQWADSGTLELLRRALLNLRHAPLYLVLSARPELRWPWPHEPMTPLYLERLSPAAGQELAETLAPGLQLTHTERERLVVHSDGVPLFLEELIREVMERTPGDTPHTGLPPRLSDLLMARLDDLGSAAPSAQAAAVIGREFDIATLAHITRTDQTALGPQLNALRERCFLERSRSPAEGPEHLRFRHALFQQAAYESLLPSQRQRLHRRLAALLRVRLRSQPDAVSTEHLARHLMEGGHPGRALPRWMAAGERALTSGMPQEALQAFSAAVECAQARAAPKDKALLDAHLGQGSARIALDGYGARTTLETFKQAEALLDQQTTPRRQLCTLWGLWCSAASWHDLDHAHTLATRMERIVTGSQERLLRMAAHFARGSTAFWTAEFRTALSHLERVLSLYDPTDHPTLLIRHSENLAVSAHAYRSWLYWYVGARRLAWQEADQACAHAKALAHRPSQLFAHAFRALLAFLDDIPETTAHEARQTYTIAEQYGYPLWRVAGRAMHAWARARLGNPDGGTALRGQITAMQGIMGSVCNTLRLLLLDTLANSPDPGTELITLGEQTLAAIERQGDRCLAPLVRRLLGEHLVQSRDPSRQRAGREHLELALAEAQSQGSIGVVALLQPLPRRSA
ncbi:MAG: AAA family ATPase [Halorhodospira sp.]